MRKHPCVAVLHVLDTQHTCSGTAGHDVHWSRTGYRWTSYGRVLTRPYSGIDMELVRMLLS